MENKKKQKQKRKTERDNARAAEFQKKKKEEAEQEAAGGKEKTSREDKEEAKASSEEESEEIKESEMTISSLDSSPESRKFSFASPVQETSLLQCDTSLDISMIPGEEKDETRQDETEVHNDSQNDKVDEDKVDSLNDFRDDDDDENIDDKIEGFRKDIIGDYGDVEEDQEPGKDMKPEPPPQPPLYRPPRHSIKFSFLGTKSFEERIVYSVFRIQDLKEIVKLKSHNDYCYLNFHCNNNKGYYFY